MAGSGTILIETVSSNLKNDRLKKHQFHDLKLSFAKRAKKEKEPLMFANQIIAIESDKLVHEKLVLNLSNTQEITKKQIDFQYKTYREKFQCVKLEKSSNLRIIITNCPYDKRIKSNVKTLLEDLDLFAVKNHVRLSYILIHQKHFSKAKSLGFGKSLAFKNGGLPVIYCYKVY